jgi:NAD+ kinase
MLLGAGHRPKVSANAATLRAVVEQHADVVLADFDGREDLSTVEADFAVVLGGDGSILRAGQQMRMNQRPVLGVNLGRLGFLADISPDDLAEILPEVCAGSFTVAEHVMFQCRVTRAGQLLDERLGLNEVAVLSGPPFSLVHVDLYVDSELATTYSCDGLIVSTPVGSTAHNLSAGGPILQKSVQAFVISPISPHTLTVRPVVDTADRIYEIVVQQPNEGTTLVVDGREVCRLTSEDRVRVWRAEPTFKLIVVRGRNYYRTLREKLGWAGNIRER